MGYIFSPEKKLFWNCCYLFYVQLNDWKSVGKLPSLAVFSLQIQSFKWSFAKGMLTIERTTERKNERANGVNE